MKDIAPQQASFETQFMQVMPVLAQMHEPKNRSAFVQRRWHDALCLLHRGIRDQRLNAWLEHNKLLFERATDPIIQYVTEWSYRSQNWVEDDMLTFKYNDRILGLMRSHYRIDTRTGLPMCMVEIVQGNEKEDREIMAQVKNLREAMLTIFLGTAKPLVAEGWQMGLINNLRNTRLRDRFCEKQVKRFPSAFGRALYDEYCSFSMSRRRVQEIFKAENSNL
ncbi:MAG TPA: hypothetical protein VJK52_05820 [Candidatus Nanoarchaeia archaeon]|nr:hypothetical protein [Candidatus Nanoarchaeia archaeon]